MKSPMAQIIEINTRVKYGSAKDKALTPSKRKEVYKSLDNAKDRTIFILGAYAGLRVGEIQQCRKEWLQRVSINNKEVLAITIPDECRDINNLYSLWRPKTKRGRVTYIIDKEFYLDVENYYNNNDKGIKLTIRAIQNRVYKMCSVSVHSLRATAQNYFKYELGYTAEVIATLLGHKDIRTTLQHYNSMNNAQVEAYLINKL